MITKVIRLQFLNTSGKVVSIVVPNPLDTLTEAGVRAAMQTLIDTNVFTSSGGALVSIQAAFVVTTERVDIITAA